MEKTGERTYRDAAGSLFHKAFEGSPPVHRGVLLVKAAGAPLANLLHETVVGTVILEENILVWYTKQ